MTEQHRGQSDQVWGQAFSFLQLFRFKDCCCCFFLIKSCPDSSGNNSHQTNAQKEACLFINRNCCPNDTLKTPNSWLLLQGHCSRSPLPPHGPHPLCPAVPSTPARISSPRVLNYPEWEAHYNCFRPHLKSSLLRAAPGSLFLSRSLVGDHSQRGPPWPPSLKQPFLPSTHTPVTLCATALLQFSHRNSIQLKTHSCCL